MFTFPFYLGFLSDIIRCKGCLELVDGTSLLPQLQRKPGLTDWKVMDDRFQIYPSYDDYRKQHKKRRPHYFHRSLWPPSTYSNGNNNDNNNNNNNNSNKEKDTKDKKKRKAESNNNNSNSSNSNSNSKGNESDNAAMIPLERCMRFYPHLQDTGGFFVALLKKVGLMPMPNNNNNTNSKNGNRNTQIAKGTNNNDKKEKTSHSTTSTDHFQYHPIPSNIWKQLNDFFGLEKTSSSSSLRENLYSRSSSYKTITYIGTPIRDHSIESPGASKLHAVWTGITIFDRNHRTGEYFITQVFTYIYLSIYISLGIYTSVCLFMHPPIHLFSFLTCSLSL